MRALYRVVSFLFKNRGSCIQQHIRSAVIPTLRVCRSFALADGETTHRLGRRGAVHPWTGIHSYAHRLLVAGVRVTSINTKILAAEAAKNTPSVLEITEC